MVSISFGWDNDLDPKLMRHPANCDLTKHKVNQEKNQKCSITKDELQTRIFDFERLYPDWNMNTKIINDRKPVCV